MHAFIYNFIPNKEVRNPAKLLFYLCEGMYYYIVALRSSVQLDGTLLQKSQIHSIHTGKEASGTFEHIHRDFISQ